MDKSTLSIMEVREDIMVSPNGDSEPALRSAHFLKPLAKSLDGAVSEVIASSMTMPLPLVFEPKEWPLVIHYKGWHHVNRKWVEWVDTLQLRYESVWKKVGIFEAIMSTKCSIVKYKNLCIGVAEKWCPETNTFLFPWGEATITLEDVMLLGGYPLVGDPVFTTLESLEMREVEKKLIHERQEPWRRSQGKASLSAWMDLFVNSGSEIEHEAFLATWLSMVVFSRNDLVSKLVFPIAIHLARGNPIALGPAVLASIYQDLTLLKKTIVGLTKKLELCDNVNLEVNLQSPFYLVQIWVWERFLNLQPLPKLIDHESPLLFRWDKVKALKVDNVRLALDSAGEHFRWRPYVQHASKFKAFYHENETWVPFDTNLDEKIVSFVTCLKVSVLVGFQSTIMLYLPHRVAMQFGMDQDVPACVPTFYGTEAIAWKNYLRPISDENLYFPARLFEGDVTTRYAEWWKQFGVNRHHDFAENIVRRRRSLRRPRHRPHLSKANNNGNDVDVPPGFSPKFGSTVCFGKSGDDDSNALQGNSNAYVNSGFHGEIVPSGSSVQDGLRKNEYIDADVPTRCKNLSNQSSSASTADYENVKRISPLTKPVEPFMLGLGGNYKDANESKESWLSSEKASLSSTQGESFCHASGIKVRDLEERINRLRTEIKKLKIAKFGHC